MKMSKRIRKKLWTQQG